MAEKDMELFRDIQEQALQVKSNQLPSDVLTVKEAHQERRLSRKLKIIYTRCSEYQTTNAQLINCDFDARRQSSRENLGDTMAWLRSMGPRMQPHAGLRSSGL